jgi:hypothetical protein
MIKLSFIEPHSASWRRWREKCDAERDKCIEDVGKGRKPKISDLYKKQKSFFRSADGPFKGKCAYCEQKIAANQHGDVEHYRPKGKVQNEDWTTVMLRAARPPVVHPGYYWLAYDWRNLLLSCVLCNQIPAKKEYGKGNRFPVDGAHAEAPTGEADEHPKLLNPCWDNPADHIEVDDTGVFTARTERGRATIVVLGLNYRELPDERGAQYEAALNKFDSIIGRRRDKGAAWVLAELRKLTEDEKQPFAAVVRAAYKKAATDLLGSIPAPI